VNKTKIIWAAIVWLLLLAMGVSAWKWVIQPSRDRKNQEQAKQEAEASLAATSGTSRYTQDVTIGLDSFSGYAILRTPEFQNQLSDRGIKLKLLDDAADYSARASALEKGSLQLAVFPADALIKAFSKMDYPPATIIAIIDETRGADAMLAYKKRFANVDQLNSPDVRFVLVADSPSETLARVVMQDFGLSQVTAKSIDAVASPEKVVERYRNASPSTNEVYVVWEPFVSQMLANEALHVLTDSSKFTGYIVDTLVVNRDFLLKHEPVVEAVLESYFSSLFAYRDATRLSQLMLDDAKRTKLPLDQQQAAKLVSGIQWKNTQENFAHFGLRPGAIVHIENILERVLKVLKSTGAVDRDPGNGKLNQLFFDRPMKSIMSRNFYPGVQSETIREESALKALSDGQWASLVSVGTLSVPELVFPRGSSNLTERSRAILDELSVKLQAWPQYYLMIRGNASNLGDVEANRQLAAKRGQGALEYLLSAGIPKERMRTVPGDITGETRVTFAVGEIPY
jgi:outer membrane protein OmpA-like peptidoglycan-associated protein/ABC-type taurine transport system substrate-binding protein